MATKKRKDLQIKTTAALLLAILITLLVYIFRNKLNVLDTFGYFGIFLLSILGNATIILPIPSILTAYLGGGIFNPFWVGIIAAFGATIGELTGYLAGYGGRTILKNPKKLQKIESWMKKYGLWTVFVLAVIPNPLFDLAGIASGILRIPVRKYFLVTWAGKIIKFLGFSYLGAGSFKLIEKFL